MAAASRSRRTRRPSPQPEPEVTGGSAKARRSAARLAAVQLLYQIDFADPIGSGPEIEAELDAFIAHRVGREMDGLRLVPADTPLLRRIVLGVAARRAELDEMIAGGLDSASHAERLDRLLRAILRAGLWELLAETDTPRAILVAEYLDVTAAFYEQGEVGLVNAVLDRLADRLRAGEPRHKGG